MSIDGHGLVPTRPRVLFRRAPGTATLDFGQTFLLQRVPQEAESTWCIDVVSPPVMHRDMGHSNSSEEALAWVGRGGLGAGRGRYTTVPRMFARPPVPQDYETPLLPSGCIWRVCGTWCLPLTRALNASSWHWSFPSVFLFPFFLLQFVFGSTHGDPYYLGLNGLAFYDACGRYIPLHPSQVLPQPSVCTTVSPMCYCCLPVPPPVPLCLLPCCCYQCLVFLVHC